MINSKISYGVIIDSCVILEILLGQSLSAECEDAINLLRKEQKTVYLTPIIIYEVLAEIEKELEKENHESTYYQRDEGKRAREEALKKYYHTFARLVKDAQLICWDYEDSSFWEILLGCSKLRLGIRGEKDKFNLAIAIWSDCPEFLTKDNSIIHESTPILKMSKNRLKIIPIT